MFEDPLKDLYFICSKPLQPGKDWFTGVTDTGLAVLFLYTNNGINVKVFNEEGADCSEIHI